MMVAVCIFSLIYGVQIVLNNAKDMADEIGGKNFLIFPIKKVYFYGFPYDEPNRVGSGVLSELLQFILIINVQTGVG